MLNAKVAMVATKVQAMNNSYPKLNDEDLIKSTSHYESFRKNLNEKNRNCFQM